MKLLQYSAAGVEREAPVFDSVVKALQVRATEMPDRPVYTFLVDGENPGERLTYAELDRRARALGGALQALGLRGERALLLFPPGLDFVAAFFGCLYAGVVAVPAYPPRPHREQSRLRSITCDAQPAAVLTTATIRARFEILSEQVPELRELCWLAAGDPELDGAASWRDPGAGEATLAFLQYTSGSTSTPKGVMVSHGNLIHNQEIIRRAFGQDEESVIVGWLPLYHDMGLIGNVLQPLYVGGRCILMSPASFLQKPLRWLDAISRYRATTSGGPNFAYDLCVSRVREAERLGLDLSRWRVAFNGAEPVRAATLERFSAAFAPAGFRRSAFYPCYGLAEGTLFAAGGRCGSGPLLRTFEAAALEENRAVIVAEDGAAAARPQVGCGTAWMDQEIVIADPETGVVCAPGRVGEIWLSGPSVAHGYWGCPEESGRTFGATLQAGGRTFLRTGDLGVFCEGELFVTGRLKDLIILRGRNLYPQDLEATVEASHPALRQGCGAAFSVERDGEERLVLVQEVDRRAQERIEAGAVAEAIRRAVALRHEAQIYEVVLVGAGTIPKTSSGKIQRHACRAGYLSGSLAEVGRSVAAVRAASEPEAATVRAGELLTLPLAERRAALECFLIERLARLTGLPISLVRESSPAGLGLDSLMAVELRNAIETGLGAPVPLSALLLAGGIAELADLLLAGLAEPARTEAEPAVPETTDREHPLSAGQKGLWLLEHLAPGSGVCNIGGAARSLVPLDVEALRRSLARLARRHSALRLVFGGGADAPWQRVCKNLEPELVVVQAEGWSAGRLRESVREELGRPFVLESGPLLRAALWRGAPDGDALALTVHHLVADLWSLTVMMRDLGTLYAEEIGEGKAELPALPLAFPEHVRRQERRLAGPEGEWLRSYWSERLAGPLPAIELPVDRLRPAAPSYRGAVETARLSTELTGRLRELARSRRMTFYMVLAGGLLALLHRLTGQEDLLLGTPTAGRDSGGCEPLVGYLVNLVALRLDASGEPASEDFLERVREAALGAFDHQGWPFHLVAERLHQGREAGHSPVFQVAFAFHKAHLAGLEGLGALALGEPGVRIRCGGLWLESLDVPPETAQYDLTLAAAEWEGGLVGSFQYATDLFDASTAERMAGMWRVLLDGVAADPGQALGDLPLLSPAELTQVLAGRNRTAVDRSGQRSVHELVEEQAERSPGALAVADAGSALTYAELWDRACRLERQLVRCGVGPEDRVGVCLPGSADLVVALLAIGRAGGAYVPLDPAYPAERLAYILGDADARVLLTRKDLRQALPDPGCAVLCLDAEDLNAERAVLAEGGLGNGALERQTTPDHLAYVIYTSGSTGRPKGVEVRQAGLINLVRWHLEAYGLTERDRSSAVASPAFDASTWEIWPSLVAGASLVFPAEEIRTEPAELARWLDTAGITVAFLPTPLAEAMLAHGEPRAGALRTLLTGGDRLTRRPPEGASFRLFNHYGPTESSVVATAVEVEPAGAGVPPIGGPIANTRAYVLDRRLCCMPVGVPGELFLTGAGLARGYLGRPELTAERFLPDPFGGEPGGRLYRTGDLVRWRAGGGLDFLGRTDFQVKIRGQRIELGEIEAQLAACPEVREAVALVREDQPGERRLVAYITAVPGTEATGLRERLRQCLPEAMVPAAIMRLDRLPLTPHGKVDRRALPAPEVETAAGEAPRTPLEELLASLWSQLLGLASVGRQDRFFDLGGHSLLGTRLVARLRELLGIELALRDLFAAPTLAGLAARIEATRRSRPQAVPPLDLVSRQGDLRPSFAQERLWFLDRLQPGSPVYNVPAPLRLRGNLSVPALAGALAALARRHEALRTTFAEVAGRLVQRIAPEVAETEFGLPRIDLAGLPEGVRTAELERLAGAEAARPFDLEKGPLARAVLVGLGPTDHALLLTLHHIVSDGWSLGVLVRDVAALYAAALRGESTPLAPLPLQPADLATWQRRWVEEGLLDRQLAWWRERLAGAPTTLDLPVDRPRPPVQSFRGRREPVRLPAGLRASLQALARREEVTLFMVLLAAFQILLSRHSGQRDLLLGLPTAGRDRTEVEGLIGFFANTVVVRGELVGDPTWGELLGRTRTAALDAYDHQDIPFERLVEELEPQRDLSRNPLFQAMLALQGPLPELRLAELTLEPLTVDPGVSRFDLTLMLDERDGGLTGWLEHSTDLFDRPTMQRLLGHLTVLLEGLAVERRPEDLPLLAPAELWQVVGEWNATETAVPRDLCLHDLFAAQARRTPGADAVVCGAMRMSYRELAERAHRLAHHLRALGVGTEARVGVCLERSPDLPVALLAVLLAGGAYLPLDPAYPRERLAHMLQDAGARALITTGALAGRLPNPGAVPVVRLDEDALAIAARSVSAPPAIGGPRHLAYVIYTSGSTGRPKGVAIEHAAPVALCLWAREMFGAEALAGVLGSTSVCFDLSVFEIFAPLSWGGKVILVDDALGLPAAPAAGEVTLINTVPSVFAELLRSGGVPASVEIVNLAGEPLPRALAQQVHALPTVRRLLNLYGPSEDTTYSTVAEVARDRDEAPTIGRPISGTRAFVLDGILRPVPVGVPGQLYLAGSGLARGYLGRPALTAERFVPDPFATVPGGRLYATGDLVRWRPAGELDFLGRIDHQVKVRGFRIELGEIEAQLAFCPGVREAVAVVREDRPGDRRLIAYVAAAEEVVETGSLRDRLRLRLPEPMVPSRIVVLAALPRTPNGKVDRRALPAPQVEAAESEAPRTPLEELLAGLWCELLDVSAVGRRDGFFELGGHSLLATRLVARVRELLDIELPVRELFEASTVAELAERLERARHSAPAVPPRIAPQDGLVPSFAQERLWFLDRLQPGGSTYNVPAALCLKGDLSVPSLAAALAAVAARHETLRTTFADVAGSPALRISPEARLDLPIVDLTALEVSTRQRELRLLTARETGRPFDLARGPLVRAVLLALTPSEHALSLTLHHAVVDGWSMGVLVRETAALYAAVLRAEPAILPELPVRYADFAAWQRGWLDGGELAGQLAWWREALAGAPMALELPADRLRPAVQSFRGARLPVRLAADLCGRIGALARREGATLFMTLLAAFQVVLSRQTGQEDLLVGVPVAGRRRAELEGLIGCFANTLVLRGALGGDPVFDELLGRTRAMTLGAYDRQDVPFERLVEELQPQRDLGRNPLFQVMLALQNVPAPRAELPGLVLEPLEVDPGISRFDLALTLEERHGGLEGWLEHSTDLFDRSTMLRLLGHLETLLAGLAAERRISDLPLLTAAEERQVLAEWSATGAAFPRDLCLHELILAQARRTPDTTAVLCGEDRLLYGELAARAGRLARRLRAAGVGPEVRVGICLERSPDLLVALLAVLAAGGAYLPLDPAFPAERLAYMLEDSGARVLLTSAALRGLLPVSGAALVVLDELNVADGGTEALAEPATPLDPEHLAYVLYTSGSTGRPKGVQVRHRALVNFLTSMARQPGLTWRDVLLAVTTLSFDIAVLELFLPLMVGARVVLARREEAIDGRRLRALLDASGATVMQATPATWRMLLESGWEESPRLKALCGGEALPPDLAIALRAGCRSLWNLYGPTETTVWSAAREIGADDEGPVPVGGPVANTRLLVLDGRLRPLPVGVPGQLFLGGEGLARGYLGRPGLTAEKFIPEPFGDPPGGRLYATGDLVRWRRDGDLDFLGRIDHQVKVRGFRIEPGEIEAQIGAYPGVRQAVVAARPDGAGLRLVAWVAGDPAVEPGALRAFLATRLPEHMVPSVFVVVTALPLTPNGKIDRRALPDPEPARSGAAGAAPSGPTEELLAGIWSEVLGLESVGAGDHFFELGGHSLLATRLASRIAQAFCVELPLRAIFESPVLADLAGRIDAERAGGEAAAAPPIRPLARHREASEAPVSFAQHRLWFLHRLDPHSPAFNLPVALRISGDLRPALLERALEQIVERHESLRTTFHEMDGEPVQRIAPPGAWRLPLGDLAELPAEVREAEALRLAQETARQPFDLRNGPLLRTRLLRLGADEHLLLFCMHHIISDAWSMGVLVREAAALYAAIDRDLQFPLPAATIQYADFAAWQRSWLRDATLHSQLAYWERQLDGAPTLLTLPVERRGRRPSRAAGQRAAGRRVRTLPGSLVRGLRRLARRHDGTLFLVLSSGFAALLHGQTGRTDLVIGTDVANRNRAETEGLIGFFVNQLALRFDLAGDPRFEELLARSREVLLGAYAHQDLPFERLVEIVNPERDPDRSPLFQIKLNLQNAPTAVPVVPGLALTPVELHHGMAQLDLILNLEERGDGLDMRLEFRMDLFDREPMDLLLEQLEVVLAEVVERPEIRLSELGARLSAVEAQRRAAAEGGLDQARLKMIQGTRRRGIRA